MEYDESDYIMLSGIQHFVFCRRQWALIHIENQWSENILTAEGMQMHKNADDPFFTEKRRNIITVRSMRVVSHELKITGVCDVVEFINDENGISITGRDGKFRVRPVEYKRGEPKNDRSDILQLAAQAMCLEEMLCCSVNEGCLFYGKTHHRQDVSITDDIRDEVRSIVSEMYDMFSRNFTPRVRTSKRCRACSLKEICMPELMRKNDVENYIHRRLDEDYL